MKLIFVYNADSGLINSMLDFGHKIVSPETYSCNLCKLTFGSFTENKTWKEFRAKSKYEMVFYHRDEFENKYNAKFDYPVVLLETDKLQTVISKEKLNEFQSLRNLIDAVNKL